MYLYDNTHTNYHFCAMQHEPRDGKNRCVSIFRVRIFISGLRGHVLY